MNFRLVILFQTICTTFPTAFVWPKILRQFSAIGYGKRYGSNDLLPFNKDNKKKENNNNNKQWREWVNRTDNGKEKGWVLRIQRVEWRNVSNRPPL